MVYNRESLKGEVEHTKKLLKIKEGELNTYRIRVKAQDRTIDSLRKKLEKKKVKK